MGPPTRQVGFARAGAPVVFTAAGRQVGKSRAAQNGAFGGALDVSNLAVGSYEVEAHCGVVLYADLDVVLPEPGLQRHIHRRYYRVFRFDRCGIVLATGGTPKLTAFATCLALSGAGVRFPLARKLLVSRKPAVEGAPPWDPRPVSGQWRAPPNSCDPRHASQRRVVSLRQMLSVEILAKNQGLGDD